MKTSIVKDSKKPQSIINRKIQDYKRNWSVFILLVPGIIYYVVFCYVPLYGVTIAFKD